MLEEHETRASTESIDSEAHEYDVPTTVTETEQLTGATDVGGAGGATTSTTDICTAVASTSVEAVYVETDIDADETPPPSLDIVHKKDLSTDSAVYVLDEHISHHKGLNNVTTEGTSALPPYHERFDDDDNNNDNNNNEKDEEKEKPQRTITRRKKGSSLANSRNNSCVSTDSRDSTGTVDSGIVVTDSQRASPMSDVAPSSYLDKELNGSRETLDEDIVALEAESTSSSDLNRDEEAKTAGYQLLGKTYTKNSRSGSVSSDGLSRAGELANEKVKYSFIW